MGGFLGIGGSAAKTDRGAELGARQGLWNVFNYALPTGQTGQTTGTQALNTAMGTAAPAASYWKSLLAPGRAQATANAAPAVNTALDQSDAVRRQAEAMGTGRTGGTAAAQREAGTTTTKNIDDIINQSLQTGRAAGAQGLTDVARVQAGVGSTELQNALNLLGLGEKTVSDIGSEALKSYQGASGQGTAAGAQQQGQEIAQLAMAALMA